MSQTDTIALEAPVQQTATNYKPSAKQMKLHKKVITKAKPYLMIALP